MGVPSDDVVAVPSIDLLRNASVGLRIMSARPLTSVATPSDRGRRDFSLRTQVVAAVRT
jgi:hypothetical protein